MSERREASRRRVYLGARVVHPHGPSSANGLLRNLSASGARMSVSAAVPLPLCFTLVIERCGTRRLAETVWRSGDAIGVRFVTPPPESADAPGHRACEAEMRAELARLRARVAQIELHHRPADTSLH